MGAGKSARVRLAVSSAAALTATSVAVFVTYITAAAPVWAAGAADLSKLSPDLTAHLAKISNQNASLRGRAGSSGARIRVLVRSYRPMTYATRLRYQGQVSVFGRAFKNIDSAVVEVTPEQLAHLAADPTVASLSPDRAVSSAATLDVNSASVGADVAGQSFPGNSGHRFDGSGAGIAVIDSGVAPVEDIRHNLAAFKDFVNGRTLPYDDYGHGTHVAGIIAGSGAASSGANAVKTYRGVAPGAGIVALKVLNANGTGSVSNVLSAIDWAIANRAQYRIRVINLSLGSGVYESYRTDPLCQAAEKAVAAGIVVVASAGNFGGVYGGVGSPANDPNVIAVGASNTRATVGRGDDMITSYTARGPSRYDLCIKPDLLAPGNRVVSLRAPGSTIDTKYPQTQVSTSEYLTDGGETGYTRLSGTSMAAPSVAAAAAIAFEVNPALQPNGVKAALMFSAQLLSGYDPVLKRSGVYDPLTQGAGELNVPGALEIASKMRREIGLRDSLSLVSYIDGQPVPWAGETLKSLLERPGSTFAQNLAWGGTGDWAAEPIWAENLAWGGTGDAPSAIAEAAQWNDNLVWGGNLAWGGTGDASGTTVDGNNLAWGGTGDASATGYELIWAENLAWGGTGDYTPSDPNQVEGGNLAWGGTGDYTPAEPSYVNGSNLAWGGTGDAPATEAPVAPDNVWAGNLAWGGTGDYAPPMVTGDDDSGVAP